MTDEPISDTRRNSVEASVPVVTTTPAADDVGVSPSIDEDRRELRRRRTMVIAAWATVAAAWIWYQVANDLGPTESAQRFLDWIDSAWWGIAAYVGVYLLRPLVLFPASVLTVVGGILFGPVLGIAVVVVAANLSALIAYGIGRTLRSEREIDPEQASVAARWSARMRDNSFETVLVMRLLFLPYDFVNYLSGLLRIKWVPFLVATALGSLPGTVSFVLIGASLERVDQGFDGLDPGALAIGLVIFVVSLLVARILRRRTPDSASPAVTS